jgi:fucose permease
VTTVAAEFGETGAGRCRIAIASLYLGGVLIGLIQVAVPSSSAYLLATHDLSDGQYGQVFLAQLLAAIAGALIAGPAIRKWTLKSIYGIALLCFVGSQVALATTEFVPKEMVSIALVISLGLFGFGFGFGGGPLNGLVASTMPRHSDAAITALHFCAGAGLMIGPLLVRQFEASGLWLVSPLANAMLAVAILFLVLAAGPFTEPVRTLGSDRRMSDDGSSDPSFSRHFKIMLAIAFLYALVEASFSNWAVLYVSVTRAESLDAGAHALAAFWGSLTVGRLIATIALRRIRPYPVWMALPGCMAGAYIAVANSTSAFELVLSFGLAGLACSAFFPLTVSAAARPYPEHTSWIASMLTAGLMVGVGVSTYAIGTLVGDRTLNNVYTAFTLVPALLLVLMFWTHGRQFRSDRSKQNTAQCG